MLDRRTLFAAAALLILSQVAAADSASDLYNALDMVLRFKQAGIPAHNYSIPSGSMIPTLQVGDTVLADERPAGKPPARGDLIAFKSQDTIYLKRVVGMPGERVQMINGRLSIDGTLVPREELAAHTIIGLDGKPRSVPHYRESLPGGASHEIIEIEGDTGFSDNTVEFLVPEGAYFTLGDNRDNSSDSRHNQIGFVRTAAIVGLIIYRLRPNSGWLVPKETVSVPW